MVENENNRLAWADVAKGIGILAVIFGHHGTRLMVASVFPWHMPLFFVLSGYFLSVKSTLHDFCCRKFRALMIPYAVTSVALILAEGFWVLYRNGSKFVPAHICEIFVRAICGSGSLQVFGVVRPIGAIWFLEALFVALLVVRIVAGMRFRYVLVAVLFLIAWWSRSVVWLPFNIQSGLFAVPFVLYGSEVLRRVEIRGSLGKVFAVVGLLMLVTIVSIGRPHMSMVRNFASIFDLIAAPLVVQFVLLLSSVLADCRIAGGVLSWYGRNSLTILCCHLFELSEVPWSLVFSHLGLQHLSDNVYMTAMIGSKIIFVTFATLGINIFRELVVRKRVLRILV